MKAIAASWTPARLAADGPAAHDCESTSARPGSLSAGAAIDQAVADPLQCARHGHSYKEDEIASLLKQRSLQSIDLLIKWMVLRRIRTIEASADALRPHFRPQGIRATLADECSDLVAEFGDGMPEWRIASWFSSPNARLFDLSPANLLPCDWHVVVDVARLDKLDATGESNL